jgi:glutamate/tyrosine decarboxylase-like PLP-dependent enzyme
LRKIPARDDFTIDLEKLEAQILKDQAEGYHPICIVGNGGAVNTGAVDPLDELADLAQKYKLWFHIDAAYGGPAAATKLMRAAFKGIERADSIALDPHKWLYVPFEAGCALIRDKKLMRETFSVLPDYLRLDKDNIDRTDFSEYGFQLSRNFKALKVWMTFKAYGAQALRDAIQSNIQTMRYLGSLIEKSKDFELLAPVPLSAVCFRYRGEEPRLHQDEDYLARLNKKLISAIEHDGRLFITGTIVRGRLALRACSVNHRLERSDVEYVLEILRELGASVHSTEKFS